MLTAVLELLAGFLILTVGGHFLVRGAVTIAFLSGLSTAVVGLTVVAFGTSLPELAVSVNAAAAGSTDIAYANVVGSSIFNLAVILAITALIRPVVIPKETRSYDYPTMLAVLAACLFLGRDRLISRPEGAALLVGLVAFLALTYLRTRTNAPAPANGPERNHNLPPRDSPARRWWVCLGLVAVGLLGPWGGSACMARGARPRPGALEICTRVTPDPPRAWRETHSPGS